MYASPIPVVKRGGETRFIYAKVVHEIHGEAKNTNNTTEESMAGFRIVVLRLRYLCPYLPYVNTAARALDLFRLNLTGT